jgi:hypothetical protein
MVLASVLESALQSGSVCLPAIQIMETSVSKPVSDVAGQHIVQFFDGEDSRARCVAIYLAHAYGTRHTLLVVAQSRHWIAIRQQLEASDVPVQQAIATGRLVVKDAAETLRRITRKGSPDASAFDATIGAPLATLHSKGASVSVYGEMVDLLAQAGDLPDAIRLERLWNDLAARLPFSLMCGYSAAHFVSTSTHRALLEICATHTEVHRHSADALASWLLDSARDVSAGAGRLAT